MTPRISVIIPARDEAARLPRSLESLRRQTLPSSAYEVIVVDDGSRDSTAEIAEAAGARVLSQANRGPASARNAGAQVALGELLVFTDADCEAAPDFLAEIARAFEDPAIAGAMGAYRSKQRQRVARFVQAEFDFKQRRMARMRTINTVHTYAGAYRREVFLATGGFDERYPIPSNEDQELSYRLAGHGHTMVFEPDAVVFHLHDRTLAEYIRRKFWLGYWKAYTLSKHPRHIRGDSHTPRSQMVQIALALPTLIAGLLAPLSPLAAGVAWGLAAAFTLSALPFVAYVLRQAPGLAWMVPGMTVVRAIAQAAGLLFGFLKVATWRR